MKPHVFHLHGNSVMQHTRRTLSSCGVGPGTGITECVAVNSSAYWNVWCIVRSYVSSKPPGERHMPEGKIVRIFDAKGDAKQALRAYNNLKDSGAAHLSIQKRRVYIAAQFVDEAVRPVDFPWRRPEELVAEHSKTQRPPTAPRKRKAVRK